MKHEELSPVKLKGIRNRVRVSVHREKSILIVEDDLTFATMLKTWLGKKGFSVDTASSNARARKQLDAQP